MISRQRITFLVLSIGWAAAVILATYAFAAKKAGNDIREAGERQLQIIALDLESVLEKFETLPFALGFEAEVAQALAHPDDKAVIARLNRSLQIIQRQSKVVAIYLMDRQGTTLASSNWDQPLSFVGGNFSFRPYFKQAIAGHAGRFYGIGHSSSEPGYYIAQPIYPADVPRGTVTPIGVMTVKIDLTEFEHTWRTSADPITLADQGGVVFLSNRPAWKYHSLQPLDQRRQQNLAGTRQYEGRSVAPITSLPAALRTGLGEPVIRPIGRLGWQLMLFPAQARIARSAMLWTVTATLLLAIAALSMWAFYQRRRRLEERLVSRNALQRAAADLDRKIAQRTGELLLANQDLERKYITLKQTEHLLRSTQNELVQAGKLAMLGQMAAGVTHELNQPLTAIRAFADNAVTFLSRGQTDQAGANLAQISAASARMGAIIGQLKGFARKSHETLTIVDLQQSISASAMLLHNDLQRHGVSLEIHVEHPVQVMGDAGRIEQVLINLLRNAIDAVDGTASRLVSLTLSRENEYAVLAIRDTGPGIPGQIAQQLFEPFFTTKPAGKGLGLGLAISSSIIQAMNGQLTAHNHPEGGAEFIVRLPLPPKDNA